MGAGPAQWRRCDAELKASGEARFLAAGLFVQLLALDRRLKRTHWFETNRRLCTAASVQGVHVQRDSIVQPSKSGGGKSLWRLLIWIASLCADLTDAVLEPL